MIVEEPTPPQGNPGPLSPVYNDPKPKNAEDEPIDPSSDE